ncbi:hypothetical protein [Ruminococcus sp.]|uniref:hypothetical protein n=1 Tax=Ruminococcus sp. TaxID=41978 RepID=UPI00386BA542
MKQFSKGTISKDFNKSISLINHTEKTIIVGVPNNEWENKIISDYMRINNSKNEHENDTDRADLEMMLNHQIETINIPDYYLRMLRLPSDKRSLINDGVSHLNNNGEITIHMGKNFEALLSYLCSEQQCTLYEIIHGFFNNIIMKIEMGHDSFSGVSTSWINKIQNMKDSISFQDKNMLVASYFCANNFISPSFIEKGYGTIYMFYENASNKIQTTEEQFQEYLLRKYNDGKKKIEKNRERIKLGKKPIDFDDLFNIADYLDNEIKVKGQYEKWQIMNMFRYNVMDKKYSDLLNNMIPSLPNEY